MSDSPHITSEQNKPIDINSYKLIQTDYKLLTNKSILDTYKTIIINSKFNDLLDELVKNDLINDEILTDIKQNFYNTVSYLL
jgi:hypothetical protein